MCMTLLLLPIVLVRSPTADGSGGSGVSVLKTAARLKTFQALGRMSEPALCRTKIATAKRTREIHGSSCNNPEFLNLDFAAPGGRPADGSEGADHPLEFHLIDSDLGPSNARRESCDLVRGPFLPGCGGQEIHDHGEPGLSIDTLAGPALNTAERFGSTADYSPVARPGCKLALGGANLSDA